VEKVSKKPKECDHCLLTSNDKMDVWKYDLRVWAKFLWFKMRSSECCYERVFCHESWFILRLGIEKMSSSVRRAGKCIF
jgi:hypothetical protein